MGEVEKDDFEIRRQLLQVEMLYEIGMALNESLDLTHVAQEILNRAVVMVDARFGLLLVRDREEGLLEPVAQLGVEASYEDVGQVLLLEEIREAWTKGELIQKTRTSSVWRHLCIVPLESRKEVSGLLIVADKERRDGTIGPFGENDESLLHTFAYQAGAALQNARLHRRLEESRYALQESEERLRGLVTHLADGVCLLDEGRRLILANPAGQAYLSLLADGVAPGAVVSRIGEYPVAELLASSAAAPAREVVVEGPPQRIFEVEANPIAEEAAGGRWAVIIRDVTGEREIQEKVQQQDRLAATGRLAAGIAHDFNNMLTIMMGHAQLLEEDEDIPEWSKRSLRSIFTQGQRAAELIRQILDFSSRTVVQRQPVDLASFLKETMELLERVLPENIRLVTGSADGKYIVNANLTQLEQTVTNLVVNARDAMPDGGELRLELSQLRVEPDGLPPWPAMAPSKWVVLAVSDTGTGIPEEVMEHVFEPFFTTKEPGEGTGLGLAQVYGIVKQHGGYIDVESAEGKGTAFTVYLPGLAGAEAAPRQAAAEIPRGMGRQ